jgi:cytochrome c553
MGGDMLNKRIKLAFAAVVAAASVFLLPQAYAGNAEAGAKINSNCVGCHAIPGYKTAFPVVHTVPKIAGQSAAYLEAALKAYKSGERSHPSMVGISRSLTDANKADLAAYYAGKGLAKPAAATVKGGNIAAGKVKADAACAACHGADGVKSVDPSFPILAGQYQDYLARALNEYQKGTRKNAIMMGMAAALTKQEIADLAAFYASLPSPLNSNR